MRALDFLGSPANLVGAGSAIVVGAGAAFLGAAPWVVLAGVGFAYAGGLLVSAPRKREIHVSVGGEDAAAVADGLREAQEQLAAQRGALPAPIVERADAVLAGIGELMPRWNTDMRGLVEEKTVVRSILADYLPTSLNGYLALPRSYLTRTKAAAEQETVGQLDLLVDTVHGIQDQVFDGVEQKIRAQSQFLRDKFARGGGLQL
jgi:hypothetical protein